MRLETPVTGLSHFSESISSSPDDHVDPFAFDGPQQWVKQQFMQPYEASKAIMLFQEVRTIVKSKMGEPIHDLLQMKDMH